MKNTHIVCLITLTLTLSTGKLIKLEDEIVSFQDQTNLKQKLVSENIISQQDDVWFLG